MPPCSSLAATTARATSAGCEAPRASLTCWRWPRATTSSSSAHRRVAVRRAGIPVLVARGLSGDAALGDRVVLVLGDAGGDARAAGLAAALARDAGGDIAATVSDHGGDADAILRAAGRADATMIAIGGPTTPRWRNAADLAVTVAERAPCSVLVARARE